MRQSRAVIGKGKDKIQAPRNAPSYLLPPTRPHLPHFNYFSIVYSDFKSINGLSY
jgi:hypothetical protein